MELRKYIRLIIFNKKTVSKAIILILIIFPSIIKAQDKKARDRGEIEDTQIIIEKDKKIVLPEAVRNFEKVPVQPKNQVRQIQPYKLQDDFEVSLADIETKMRVLTAKQDDLKKLYGNYLKGGYGSYGTSLLEGFFNNKRNERFSYGARVKHLASRFGHVDQENSGNSDNEAEIFGKAYSDPAVFSASVDFNRERYNFYGYRDSETPDNDDIKHLLQTYGAKINIDNNLKDAALDYHIFAQASRIFNNYNANENEFGVGISGGYTLATSSKILANLEFFITKREDVINTVSRSFFKASPYYQFTYEGFLLKLGGNIIYENDSIRTSKLHIFPSAQASYELIPEITAFAGVEGDVYRTSLKGFLNENPYLAPGVTLLHTQKPLEIYGGFKGKVLTNLAYNLKVSAANYKNLYFYKNQQETQGDPSKFEIAYDNSTAVLGYLAELSYSHSEAINLGIKLEGFGYTLSDLEQHWHRPNYTGTFIGRFNIRQKIAITTELFYINGLIADDEYNGETKELDDIVDLNVKLDYRFSSKFSAFVHANNILGKNYQRYLYYPTRGFNILAGLTFSF